MVGWTQFEKQKNVKTLKNKLYPQAKTPGDQSIMSQDRALACLPGRLSDGNLVSSGIVFSTSGKSESEIFFYGSAAKDRKPNSTRGQKLGIKFM